MSVNNRTGATPVGRRKPARPAGTYPRGPRRADHTAGHRERHTLVHVAPIAPLICVFSSRRPQKRRPCGTELQQAADRSAATAPGGKEKGAEAAEQPRRWDGPPPRRRRKPFLDQKVEPLTSAVNALRRTVCARSGPLRQKSAPEGRRLSAAGGRLRSCFPTGAWRTSPRETSASPPPRWSRPGNAVPDGPGVVVQTRFRPPSVAGEKALAKALASGSISDSGSPARGPRVAGRRSQVAIGAPRLDGAVLAE